MTFEITRAEWIEFCKIIDKNQRTGQMFVNHFNPPKEVEDALFELDGDKFFGMVFNWVSIKDSLHTNVGQINHSEGLMNERRITFDDKKIAKKIITDQERLMKLYRRIGKDASRMEDLDIGTKLIDLQIAIMDLAKRNKTLK